MEKLYYSIGEVSDIVGHEPHVLRYWEQEFDALSPRKNRAGRRIYTEEDVALVERIRRLLKEEKYTIAGARQALQREKAQHELREDLKDLRGFLQDLKEHL
jgi:DNA-binding transcriptional MerR regulator